MLKVFPDLRRHCRVFLPREDARRLKPDPGHLLQALAAMGVDPGRALMAGDHPMDVVTGKKAGTLSAGLWSGHTDQETLSKSAPDILVPDLPALLERLGELGLLPHAKGVA